MTTRRTLITQKYVELETQLKTIITDGSLFPSLDEVDIEDLVVLVTTLFFGIDTEDQYKRKLMEMIDAQDLHLHEDQITRALPLVISFISWMKTL